MSKMLESQFVREVRARSIKARAMRFQYGESYDETIRHIRRIEACLSVKIHCANDQGAFFCHLRLDDTNDRILQGGDWVVVDSFGKISAVRDQDFNVYYEPE